MFELEIFYSKFNHENCFPDVQVAAASVVLIVNLSARAYFKLIPRQQTIGIHLGRYATRFQGWLSRLYFLIQLTGDTTHFIFWAVLWKGFKIMLKFPEWILMLLFRLCSSPVIAYTWPSSWLSRMKQPCGWRRRTVTWQDCGRPGETKRPRDPRRREAVESRFIWWWCWLCLLLCL